MNKQITSNLKFFSAGGVNTDHYDPTTGAPGNAQAAPGFNIRYRTGAAAPSLLEATAVRTGFPVYSEPGEFPGGHGPNPAG